MTEFTENVNKSAETEHSPFFINFRYNSRIEFNITKVFNLQSIQERIDQDRMQIILR